MVTVTVTLKTKYSMDDNFKKIQLEIHPSIVPFLTTFEKSRFELLMAYVAPVNHNVLNEATVYHIIHTLYGNYCHSNTIQTSQLEEMGNDTCVFVGFRDKVMIYVSLNKLFKTMIICSKSFFQTQKELEEGNMVIMKNLSLTETDTEQVFRQIFPPNDNDISLGRLSHEDRTCD